MKIFLQIIILLLSTVSFSQIKEQKEKIEKYQNKWTKKAELEIKMKEDTLQESDDILIETLERVHSAMSCDFGNYTEEFDTRFWKPYFNKFERKAL